MFLYIVTGSGGQETDFNGTVIHQWAITSIRLHNNGSTSKCTVRVLGEERESERHFYHAPTSLIAANKRDYLPDACFYRGTESGPLQTRNQTSTSGERPLLPPWRFS